MSAGLYNGGAAALAGATSWTSSDLRVLLTTSSYTPDVDHDYVSDVTNELSGGNYARVALSGRAITTVDASDRVELDATDTTFVALQAAAGTPARAIIYDHAGGSDAARRLIGWVDIDTPSTPTGADYSIVWPSTGLFWLTYVTPAASSSIPTTMTRMALADAEATFDPDARLGAAISDLGDGLGIRFQLTGGWSGPNPAGDYPGIRWPLNDLLGNIVTGDGRWSLVLELIVRSGPGDSTDTDVRVVVANEQGDLTSATVDGTGCGIRFTGGSRAAIAGALSNGSLSTAIGTANASGAIVEATFTVAGVGRHVPNPRVTLCDASHGFINTVNLTPGTVSIGTGDLYLYLLAGRHAATAGAVTVDVDLYILPPVVVAHPT